jgi:hypothetical protein
MCWCETAVPVEDDEDDEFHDALGDQVEEWCFTTPPSTIAPGHRRNISGASVESIGVAAALQAEEYNSSDSDSEQLNNGKGTTKVVTYKRVSVCHAFVPKKILFLSP